ncbi:MAG: ATP-binding protein [Myxococcota bacterium]
MDAERRRSAESVKALATRLVAIAAIFVLAVLLEVRGATSYSDREVTALYALVLAGFLLSLAYAALAAHGGFKRRHTIELVGDGCLITGLVYCSGGTASLFEFLYIIWIVHAAVTAGERGALLACASAMLGFGLMVLGEAGGWLPPFDQHPVIGFSSALSVVGLHSVAFLFTALLARRLAVQIQTGRRELHDLGELYQRIVDNVSSGLLTVNRQGEITSFNAEAARITGQSAEEVMGEPLAELFPTLAELFPTLPPESEGTRLQVRFRSRDGKEALLGMSISALRDSSGEEVGAILVFQDLTQIVEMEERLRRSERLSAVGQLAAGMAHEIRNPLASLSGAIELLSADLPSEGQSAGRLKQIVQRETERLERLVSDFLRYARPAQGRIEKVALGELMDEIRELLRAGDYADVRLDLEIPPDVCTKGDPDQLRQVFWNLVLNAVQSEPADGRVLVRTSVQEAGDAEGGGSVLIEVSDRGSGIPPEILERVFEPFFTTRAEGTGLGLATVHRVVEALGGELSVSSSLGEGTVVRVVLPDA